MNKIARRILTLVFLLPLVATAKAPPKKGMTEDPNYTGSSFHEVLDVIQDKGFTAQTKEELQDARLYQNGAVPHYEVSFRSLKLFILGRDSKRTIRERADYYPRIQKLVHSNGICVTGEWQIDQPSAYTGYFGKRSRALFVGRISTALQETTKAGNRGFGFAGKLFPTLNPDEKTKTTSFFTVDVLSGTPAQRFLDVALTNNPPLIPSFDLAGVLSKIVPAFISADSSPTFRPVTPIAMMGEDTTGATIKSPTYMRLRPIDGTIKNDEADFRHEVLQAMKDNQGVLRFNVDVSETTNDRNIEAGWTHLGRITIDQAILSYSCDRRLHFSHPKDDSKIKP